MKNFFRKNALAGGILKNGISGLLVSLIAVATQAGLVFLLSRITTETPQLLANTGYLKVILPALAAYAMMAVVLGQFTKRLEVRFMTRFLIIFCFNFLLNMTNYFFQGLEQVIIMKNVSAVFALTTNMMSSLVLAFFIALIWHTAPPYRSLRETLRNYFYKNEIPSVLFRLLTGWLIYVPIYYAVRRILSPLSTKIYLTGMYYAREILPNPAWLMDIQYARGFVVILLVFPVIILWHGRKRTLWIFLTLALFVQISLTSIIASYWYPLQLKLVFALELFFDCIAQTAFYVFLLHKDKPEWLTRKTQGR